MNHHKKQAAYNDKRNVLNKASLVEPIVRHRVQDSIFYKQYLYLTNESTILNVIIEHVHYIGGTSANGKPSPFLCCMVRLLELEPKQEIIHMYLSQMGTNTFKYLTAMTLMYIRFVGSSEEIYSILEEYYKDYRKLRFQLKYPREHNGVHKLYTLTYMDEWVDDLLHKERLVDLILPRLAPRRFLQEAGRLPARKYYIQLDSDVESTPEASSADSSFESDSD